MNEHIDDLLPFYINGTLAVEKREDVDAHLSACPECQKALSEWEKLAAPFQSAAPPLRAAGLPPLSPVVRANLRRRPSFPEAILSTASLIGAQRFYLKENWLIPIVAAALLAGVLAVLFLPVQIILGAVESNTWAVVPFFILVPFFAALSVVLMENQEDGLGNEIVAATPTHPGVLIFARLTLAIGMVAGLALLGSLVISGIGGFSLVRLVATWLGPMLWLSALTTLLALLWNPWIAAASTITLWVGILLLLVSDRFGASLVGFSLTPLLSPSWQSFGLQSLLAVCVWLASWLWMMWGTPPALRLERGKG